MCLKTTNLRIENLINNSFKKLWLELYMEISEKFSLSQTVYKNPTSLWSTPFLYLLGKICLYCQFIVNLNIFQIRVAFQIETNHLILTLNIMTGFYRKCNTGLKWVNRS